MHRRVMTDAIAELETHFEDNPQVYISGNMFVYYVRGDRNKHVSPDVFVAFGVPKHKERESYFVWKEGKSPDVVFEATSRSTRDEDILDKMYLYRDILKVREYFLFDPKGEYLDPPLQGYRLRQGKYMRIRLVNGRLPSQVLGLHLERHGSELRLYNPATHLWLPTPQEALAMAEAARRQAETGHRRADAARRQAEAARRQAEAEIERLRRENEELRRRLGL
jgi:Uma2 family endonuclease